MPGGPISVDVPKEFLCDLMHFICFLGKPYFLFQRVCEYVSVPSCQHHHHHHLQYT